MSVVRVGANKQYSDNWENIFSGGRSSAGKRPATKSKPGKKSPKKVAKTATKSGGKAWHEGCDHDQPNGRGQSGQPGLKRCEPERVRILEVEAEQVHESVDRARANEDGDRGADQDPVAQQSQIQ